MKANSFLRIISLLAALSGLLSCARVSTPAQNPEEMVIGAYVYHPEQGIPDPSLVTHINFAFAHVNETFDGLMIPNPGDLRKVASLKKGNPSLSVLLSVGGWGSGRFSEMAASEGTRLSFARDCARTVGKYHLDGIDIDWEFPTSSAAGISSSPEDAGNFTLLMRDLREALPEGKLLTLASVSTAEYIDLKAVLPYVDFVNVMAYDMAEGYSFQQSVGAHIKAGVPPVKLVLGMPFYGGADEASTRERCSYIVSHNLRGGMYWQWNSETDPSHPMARACSEMLRSPRSLRDVLVMYEDGGWHKPFTDVIVPWLDSVGLSHGFAVTDVRNMRNVSKEFLSDYDVIIQLDCPPYPWPKEAQEAFIDYMNEGRGGYMGFHHASLLGEFDGFPMWDWFSEFLGGIRFQGYIAETCDGTVHIEDPSHPALKGLPSSFVIPSDEWYTYDRNPRDASYIHVLATVDEDSYNPSSRVRMGDHPVIWTNTSLPTKNIYFQFGHSALLRDNEAFLQLLLDTIDWLTNE